MVSFDMCMLDLGARFPPWHPVSEHSGWPKSYWRSNPRGPMLYIIHVYRAPEPVLPRLYVHGGAHGGLPPVLQRKETRPAAVRPIPNYLTWVVRPMLSMGLSI